MRFAGIITAYSKNATPQLARMAMMSGAVFSPRKCPYQAKVIKQLEMTRSAAVLKITGFIAQKCSRCDTRFSRGKTASRKRRENLIFSFQLRRGMVSLPAFSRTMPTVLNKPFSIGGDASRDEVLCSLFKIFENETSTGTLSADVLEAMKSAAIERENASSTFLGRGLAVPHARTENLDEIRIAVGFSEAGVSWPDAASRAHLVLLLGVPSAMIRDYLLLMQKILRWHKDTKTIDADGRVISPDALFSELSALIS